MSEICFPDIGPTFSSSHFLCYVMAADIAAILYLWVNAEENWGTPALASLSCRTKANIHVLKTSGYMTQK